VDQAEALVARQLDVLNHKPASLVDEAVSQVEHPARIIRAALEVRVSQVRAPGKDNPVVAQGQSIIKLIFSLSMNMLMPSSQFSVFKCNHIGIGRRWRFLLTQPQG
jgi:hypothetical protein